MVRWFGKNQQSNPKTEIRDTLFGDLPFADWAMHGGVGEPWASFTAAKAVLDKGDREGCIRILTDIVHRKDLESRHYVQGWYFLRQLGVMPSKEKEKELYGVVVEYSLNGGLDIIAAYPDLHARYYNYSGAGSVWERPDERFDAHIQRLLNAGRDLVTKIGPWEGPRRPAPPRGHARLNMLTPVGLHFGEGPLNTLASDPLGGPLIAAALALMQELIRMDESIRKTPK